MIRLGCIFTDFIQIRLNTINKMLDQGNDQRVMKVLYHTIMDLEYATKSDFTTDERTLLQRIFFDLGIAIKVKDQYNTYQILNYTENLIKQKMALR